MAIVYVNVHLRNEILDPQGRAVLGALTRQNLSGITDVRQGKQFVLKFDGELNSEQLTQINNLAKELLSNPVIEDFSIEVKNES